MKKIIPYYISMIIFSALIVVSACFLHIDAVKIVMILFISTLHVAVQALNLVALRNMLPKQKLAWLCFGSVCCIVTAICGPYLFTLSNPYVDTEEAAIAVVVIASLFYVGLSVFPLLLGGGISFVQSHLSKSRNITPERFRVNILFQIIVFGCWTILTVLLRFSPLIVVGDITDLILFAYPLVLILTHYIKNNVRQGIRTLAKTGILFSILNVLRTIVIALLCKAIYLIWNFFAVKDLEFPYEKVFFNLSVFALLQIAIFWGVSLLAYWLTHLYDKKRQSLSPAKDVAE